jgi:hypothetical protein
MKTRKYTQGITFFATPEMYQMAKEVSDEMNIGLSEFIRDLVANYLQSHHGSYQENNDLKNTRD